MPALFAVGDKVIGNADISTFAAFGSFALLLLVDFTGPMRDRLQAQAALAVTGGVFVCVGTLASRNAWLAAAAMAVVGFVVIFAGVVSSVLAGATTALLLAFILPVSLPGPASTVPDRLAGWAMASVASLAAVSLLWPAPSRDPLRVAATTTCRTLAARLRSEIAYLMSDHDEAFAVDRDQAVKRADDAISALRRVFLATPYRPTGLSTVDRTIVRLVDELNWLNAIIVQSGQHPAAHQANPAVCDVKLAACAVLERGADLLDPANSAGGNPDDLKAATAQLRAELIRMEEDATGELPVRRLTPVTAGSLAGTGTGTALDHKIDEFITSLDPGFRAQELSFAVSLIARNIGVATAAERRTWLERLAGHQPQGVAGPLAAARERATAHLERHSVWLHNSVRGAVALGIAVLVANLTGVQHSFWVTLGTLSVLRSNALNTGQNVVRGLLGTVAGFIIGAAVLAAIGTNETRLWFILPVAILVAGVAPAAISFAAGQAGFTLVLVILFNIIQPAGWRIGLLRIEDITIGCAVSLVVGVLFWPRGARAALRRALAEAYNDSAEYLASAVDFGMSCCASASATPPAQPAGAVPAASAVPIDGAFAAEAVPLAEAVRAAAASRRLDDAFRSYLAERGPKPIPLAQATSLVTGVTGIRLAADAVVDLWQRDGGDGSGAGDRTAARRELATTTERVKDWYESLAAGLLNQQPGLPEPLAHDKVADARLVAAVRHDLSTDDGKASATAVRMIWTGDHLDAVRRLQSAIIGSGIPPAQPGLGLRALKLSRLKH